jgi:MFS family permease
LTGRARTLAGPLRHSGFRLLLTGQLVSNLGDAIYSVALPWYVLAHHGGPLLLGTVLAAYGIPRTALLLVGGHASDRWHPWTVMQAANGVRAVAVAAMAVAAASGPAQRSTLIPIAVLLGAGDGIFLPGSFAIVPALLPADALQQGNALTSGTTQLCLLAGPALGGVLIAALSASAGFGIDAITFVISAVALAGVAGRAPRARPTEHASPPPTAGDPGTQAQPTLRSLLIGEPVLVLMLVTDVILNLGSTGMARVALPALARGPFHLGASGYGALLAAMGGGLLLGTVSATVLPPIHRPLLVCSVALLFAAPLIAAIPYLGGPVPGAAALLVSAVLEALGNILAMTAYQRWAPTQLMGRVMALLLFASMGVLPVSVLLAGVAVTLAGPVAYFPLVAATVAIAATIQLSSRRWRSFGTQTEPMTWPAPEATPSR